MPSLEKSPPELVARFDAIVERFPAGQRRQMFGYPGLFVGGNLATSLFGDGWVVRLPPGDVERVLALPGARTFAPIPGRPMRGYALLPPDVVADDAALAEWIGRAVELAGSLPPKR